MRCEPRNNFTVEAKQLDRQNRMIDSLRVTDDNSKDLKTGHGGEATMMAELRSIKAVRLPTTCG